MQVTIKDIYDFYKQYPHHVGDIGVNTRFGYKRIEACEITAYDSEIITIITHSYDSSITLSTCREIVVSPDHLLMNGDNQWKRAKNLRLCDTILTQNGKEFIYSINHHEETMDLYDLQVAEVKEYYANGFVSHNSTIYEAISLGLFGRPFRGMNKPTMVNSINKKNLLVELYFDIGRNNYKIVRGVSPNIFEIYVNDVLVPQPSTIKDYQDYLEKTIIKFNFKTFAQIVVLGSRNYVSFMNLSAADRREIIEDLLDINVFSKMNIITKDKISVNKNQLEITDNEIHVLNRNLELHKKYIREHKNTIQSSKNDIQQKIESNDVLIKKCKKEIDTFSIEINDVKKQIKSFEIYSKKKAELEKVLTQIESKVKNNTNTLKFFDDNHTCPTCTQEITQEFKDKIILDKKDKIAQFIAGKDDIQIKLNEYNEKLKDKESFVNTFNNLNNKLGNTQTSLSLYLNIKNDYQKDLQKIDKTFDINTKTSELESCQKEIADLMTRKEILLNERNILSIANVILKDGGIKTKIIKQYIPIINKLMNKYLQIMDFAVSFEIDENFSEIIKSRYIDEMKYGNFSEGEKSRIDLALLFTFRTLAKMKNSISTNLLILDEIGDSSLDAIGLDALFKIMNETDNTNTFIISHRDTMEDKFDNKIKFEKYQSFSKIVGS